MVSATLPGAAPLVEQPHLLPEDVRAMLHIIK